MAEGSEPNMASLVTAPPSTALTPATREQREVRVVTDFVPMLDTAKFEHMQRVATIMAQTSMIPDSLRMGKDDKGSEIELPPHRVIANCFMIVNQAVRWGNMDPFAVAQCASVVYGRLMWEGKLVAAVLDANLGVRLKYTFTNEDAPDASRKLGVIVSGRIPGEDEDRTIEGDVGGWHKGDKSPWANPKAWKRQLRYMGAREWARAHAPAIMLGVYTDDEFEQPSRPERPTRHRRAAQPSKVITTTFDIPEDADEVPPKQIADHSATLRELQNKLQEAATSDVPAIEQEYADTIKEMDEDSRNEAIDMIEAAKAGVL